MKALADEVVAGMGDQLPQALGLDGMGLWSVCLAGSYVRGDFIEGNSDLDFHIIFQPGSDERTIHDLNTSLGYAAVRALVTKLLRGRALRSHNPSGFDWVTTSWESLPKRGDEVHVPRGRPHLPWFHVFLFDYIENLLVLWGTDPRDIMADPPHPELIATEWFDNVSFAHERHRRTGEDWRIPFTAFKSIQVAQIVFGERTLDKRRLLELYEAHVPDFVLKDFGSRMIRDKMTQRYPEKPCVFAPFERYEEFEEVLGEVVVAELRRRD